MTSVGYTITLLDPVVIPKQAATTSRPETLTYLPGSVFLGIAAKKLYTGFLQDGHGRAFDAFHSGRIRFGDAFSVSVDGALCLPSPMSLHIEKGKRADSALSNDICDFCIKERRPRFKQIKRREVMMNGSGRFHRLMREISMRTAISVETGLADEGQLFGYEALAPGQRFWGKLEGDDETLVSQLAEALIGEHFIGRSKTAEFGRIRIDEARSWEFETKNKPSGIRYIWFLSDTWFVGSEGLPVPQPTSDVFSASGIDWAKSFVRHRTVSPYNATWQKRAEARTLITRGSAITAEECDLAPGLHTFGLGQERGYGLTYVSADPLCETLRLPWALAPKPMEQPRDNSVQTEFTDWLALNQQLSSQKRSVVEQINSDIALLREHYMSARYLAGRSAGPTASQWSGLGTCISKGLSTQSVLGGSDDRDSALWGARFASGQGTETFRDFANVKSEDPDFGPRYLSRLAHAVRSVMDREAWLDPADKGQRQDYDD